jgi:DNA helicase II / ATP-dependent DNA helicase PcrA
MLIGEIIPELYRYLRNNPAAPEHSLYDQVLVDEYQDLNKAEQAVVDLLSGSAALCVVGDDDQSLYSFKYAHPEGIRSFPETHSGCFNHALLDCYRCPTGVVAIANALIGHNVDREPLQLVPVPANGPGEMWILQYPDVAPTKPKGSPPSWTARSTNTDEVPGRFSSWPSGALSVIRSTPH